MGVVGTDLMRVWDGIHEVPHLEGSVVTLGMFDGLHRGHQEVVRTAIEQARELGLPAVAITFTPHPATIHHPERVTTPLASAAQRLRMLADAGIDAVLLVSYDLQFASNSPEDFVKTYFVDSLHARAVVIGADTRFGAGNVGDSDTMRELGEAHGFATTVVTDLCDPVSGRRWSSSWVREALAAGDVETAGRVLGRPHVVRGEVVHGAKRGRQLGYPTANLESEEIGVIPLDGVYAGWLVDGAERYPAAISVGTNPQFQGVHRTVEAHVLGRSDLDLYGHNVRLEFVKWLRPMLTFDGVEGLLEQMARDVRQASEILST